MKFWKKTLSVGLALTLCAGMVVPALAVEYDISKGDVTIDSTGSTGVVMGQETQSRNDFTEADRSVTISQSNSETATDHTITVGENVTDTTIILDNVNIDVSSKKEAAMSISGEKTDVTVELEGTNTLKSGQSHAGLELSKGASATIESDHKGSLTATGGKYGGAGIGSGQEGTAGNITITGNADVTATGGEYGAGIGSGQEGTAGNITITGNADVTARGGDSAAGIGSSEYHSTAGNITITESADVTATGGKHGAGIGSGQVGKVGDITITGNAEIAEATGGWYAAGIGSGDLGTAGNIEISGSASVKKAQGGSLDYEFGGAGIGSGSGYWDNRMPDGIRRSTVGNITITENADVTAIGGGQGPGIGSGALGAAGNITITGNAKVHASNGDWGDEPAIGGGGTSTVGNITITKDADVTAYVIGNYDGSSTVGDITIRGTGLNIPYIPLEAGAYGTVDVRYFFANRVLFYQRDNNEYAFYPPEDGDKKIAFNEDGATVELPAGTKMTHNGEETELPFGGKIDEKGNIIVYKEDPTPPVPDTPPVADTSPVPDTPDDAGDPTVEIDDQAVPLASGPVTCAQFVDYLWRHEGSPAAEGGLFADHEYAPAIAWALSAGLIDEAFQPDELVTVADVRSILGSFASVFGGNAVAADALTTLTGDDGEAVLNCDQVLAEFFGEEYVLPESLDSLEADIAA